MSFQEGSEKVRLSSGAVHYFDNVETTNLYVQKSFEAFLNTLVVANDSTTDTVFISFDGATLSGEVHPKESMELNVSDKSSVYLRGSDGGPARLWGY
jgi:hypothetical protein